GSRPMAATPPARQLSRKPPRVRAFALIPNATMARASGSASPRMKRFSAGTRASRCQQVRDLGRGPADPLERFSAGRRLSALQRDYLLVEVQHPSGDVLPTVVARLGLPGLAHALAG